MKHLLIIDLQKQFADKKNGKRIYDRCLDFVKDHLQKYDSVIATYFKQDNRNLNYRMHLQRNKCLSTLEKSLEFTAFVNWKGIVIERNRYGLDMAKSPFCNMNKKDEIDIIGCDADVSVMAICFQLWDAGFTGMRILTEYIYTNAEYEDYGISRKWWTSLMKRNFENCVIIPKRRIAYDAMFIPNSEQSITYKGKTYDGCVSLYFQYQYIGYDGKEEYITFPWEQPDQPYRYSINQEHGYVVSEKDKYKGLQCFSKPCKDAFIWVDASTPVVIPFEDGVQILKDNYEIYDNINNRPAQSTSYSIEQLE